MQMRRLGNTSLQISAVALGCWPISGITSPDVNPDDSQRTLAAAADAGINFFDTACAYGISEGLLGDFLARSPQLSTSAVIASKGGLERDESGMHHRARPEDLHRQCRQSLRLLRREQIELYYLHAADPDVPVEESAGAIHELVEQGLIVAAGASNLSLDQLQRFHAICPLQAVQPAYNMLQREIEREMLPWCLSQQISACVYWPLLKGLLAGRLTRDHVFASNDSRPGYPMFQGEEWQKNHDLLDRLRPMAEGLGVSLTTLVVAWTIGQEGITSALCGAKRDWQINESAAAGNLVLSAELNQQIELALQERGAAVTRPAV